MRRGERGAAAVEFALIVPFFLTLIFGVIEFGVLLTDQISMTNAARVGARYASLKVANGPGAKAKAESDATHGNIRCTAPVATPTYSTVPDDLSKNQVKLVITCNYSPITPLGSLLKDLVLPTVINAETTMVVE